LQNIWKMKTLTSLLRDHSENYKREETTVVPLRNQRKQHLTEGVNVFALKLHFWLFGRRLHSQDL